MLPASPGAKHDQYKVVLVGDAGVGKTSLVKTLKYGCESWEDSVYKPTPGSWITNHCIPKVCRLYIVDTSGRPECILLVKQYLRSLDCAIFVFALDDPTSLKGLQKWVDLFETEFDGDATQVKKFVVGTKLDAASQSSKQFEDDFLSLAKQINAEFCTTSAKTPTNLYEFFSRVGGAFSGQKPCLEAPPTSYNPEGDCFDPRKNALILNDTLAAPGALLRYPDPVAIDTGSSAITHINMGDQRLVIYGEHEELRWGTEFGQRLQEPEFMVKPLPAVRLDSPPSTPVNPLYSCVSSKSSASTWQYKNLSVDCVLGVTVKRQPTCTKFRDIKEIAFCSSKRDGSDRDQGLFYMLMLTTYDTLFECGTDQAKGTQETQRRNPEDFKLTPRRLDLPNNNKIKSISMSSTHTVIAGDGTVQTWGDLQFLKAASPAPDVALSINVIRVACGIDFTLMLSSDWKVFSYGRGEFGQLGHGDEGDKTSPTMIQGLSNILAIGAGNHHAAAISGGYLYGWGLQCNDPALVKFETKPTVRLKDYTTVTSVSCGANHTLCIAKGYYMGIAYSWGRGTRGQLGHSNADNKDKLFCVESLYSSRKVVQKVSAGKNHSAFLTTKGEVFTCGCNQFGQLGYFTEENHSTTPKKVQLGRNADNEEIRAKEMSCSEDCTMVLTENNDVFIWGKSFYGSKIDNPVPTDVKANSITDVTTCAVCYGTVLTELVFALTDAQALVLCSAERSRVDAQALTAVVPCNISDLVSITSAGSVLLATDVNGRTYYADCQVWCQNVLSNGSASLPTDLPRALGSAIQRLKRSKSAIPAFAWKECKLSDNVGRVEATLDTFFFTTDIGDVCSWKPSSGGNIERHTELDDTIVVEISCGMQHAAALTEEGVVLTCGTGSSGQLGHGTFESVWTFRHVPLTKSLEITAVSCGSASTAVLSSEGKVYFWGQLDLPEYEKNEMKIQILKAKMGAEDTHRSSFVTSNYTTDPNTAYVLQLENKGDDQQIAVVGRQFEFNICPRSDGGNDRSTSHNVFRVEACSLADIAATRVKGKVKPDNKDTHKASILFPKEGIFEVTAAIDGLHVIGSPFKVQVEKGVLPSRCKITLIGQSLQALQSVEAALQHEEACESFTNAGLKVELWGVPGISRDRATCHAAALTSITNRGLYAYVWNTLDGNLPKVDVKYWLQMLSVKAPQAQVLLLGLNVSTGLAKRLDLKPFQEINPNLKTAVLVGSAYQLEPTILLRQIKPILEEKVHLGQEMVWFRAEKLAAKLEQERNNGSETLSKKRFKYLALECGIQGEYCFTMAATYIVEAGMGLVTDQEDVFLILQENWLTRNLQTIAGSCHHGALDPGSLAGPEKCIAELLINKQLAVANQDQTRIHVISFLEPLPKEVWSPSDSTAFTVLRYLVFKVQPHVLHTMFSGLVFKAVKAYSSVSIGKNVLVIHDAKYNSRVDCGPCFVDRRMSEVRVIVRAERPEDCGNVADSILATLFEFDDLSQPFHSVKFSCSQCLLQYIDQSDVFTAEIQGESGVICHKCMKMVMVKDLQQGYQETRAIPDLKWTTSSENTGDSEATLHPLLQPVVRYFDERLQHERKLLSEIREGFTDMIKLIEETKEYTVPRTVFLRLEVGKSQSLPEKIQSFMGPNPKWRLFLLCEGHGNGLGIHFLDIKDHKGYELSSPNEFILKHAGHLRMILQLLLNYVSPNAAVVAACLEAVGLASIFPSEEILNKILGVVKLNVTTVKRDWKKYLSTMDSFLKSAEGEARSSTDPKGLANSLGEGRRLNLYSSDYKHLQGLLSDLGAKDGFGGLVKEFRKGSGFVWVCKRHSKNTSAITAIEAS